MAQEQENTMNLYTAINPLSDDARIDARAKAAAIVVRAVGDKPRRESFQHSAVSQYPGWFTRLIALLMAIVFIAAAMPSLFRLFTAGRDYFMQSINEPLQAAVIGLSTFLLAEFLIILSTLAARVYFTGRARWIFVVPVLMGLLMALVGNWTVVRPHDVFSFLEAVIPVLTVLFVALIGERLILDSIETRHANEKAYQEALHGWQLATASPDKHPRYMPALANSLKAALLEANSKGAGATARRDLMSSLGNDHWKALVIRELQADEWYGGAAALPEPPALPEMAKAKKEVLPVEVVPFGNIPRTQDEPESMSMIAQPRDTGLHVSGNGNGRL
jgi:hypothetical protein